VVYPELGNFNEQLIGYKWHEPYDVGSVNSAIEAIKRMKNRISGFPPGRVSFDNQEWLRINAWHKHVEIIVDAVKQELSVNKLNL